MTSDEPFKGEGSIVSFSCIGYGAGKVTWLPHERRCLDAERPLAPILRFRVEGNHEAVVLVAGEGRHGLSFLNWIGIFNAKPRSTVNLRMVSSF